MRLLGSDNLILTGFMGTGKTALGRMLSQVWRRPFIDTDKLIQERTGRKISEIFATDGEAFFRRLEQRCVAEWLPDSGAIISTGGGIVTIDGMSEALAKKGVVVALFASPEVIFSRIAGNKSRPLLQIEDPAERLAKIRELYASRERAYMRSGVNVMTDFCSVEELVERVTKIYNRACSRKSV
ncbi:MAG: shikimate kinase [Opitutales bacterium]|nr:shikimate kinase [Opitutales bacterium]